MHRGSTPDSPRYLSLKRHCELAGERLGFRVEPVRRRFFLFGQLAGCDVALEVTDGLVYALFMAAPGESHAVRVARILGDAEFQALAETAVGRAIEEYELQETEPGRVTLTFRCSLRRAEPALRALAALIASGEPEPRDCWDCGEREGVLRGSSLKWVSRRCDACVAEIAADNKLLQGVTPDAGPAGPAGLVTPPLPMPALPWELEVQHAERCKVLLESPAQYWATMHLWMLAGRLAVFAPFWFLAASLMLFLAAGPLGLIYRHELEVWRTANPAASWGVTLGVLVYLSLLTGWAGDVLTWTRADKKERIVGIAAPDSLVERVAQLAAQVGAAPPALVRLVGECNAHTEVLTSSFGRDTVVLAVGAPLLELLSSEELDWVLAHELGHLHADEARVGEVYRLENLLLGAARRASAGNGPMHWFASWFVPRFHMVARPILEAHELVADRRAAEVVSGEVGARALVVVSALAAKGGEIMKLGRRGLVHPPDAPAELLARGLRASDRSLARLLRSVLHRPWVWVDSHPRLAERLLAMGSVPGVDALRRELREPASKSVRAAQEVERTLVRVENRQHRRLVLWTERVLAKLEEPTTAAEFVHRAMLDHGAGNWEAAWRGAWAARELEPRHEHAEYLIVVLAPHLGEADALEVAELCSASSDVERAVVGCETMVAMGAYEQALRAYDRLLADADDELGSFLLPVLRWEVSQRLAAEKLVGD